jgi:hypothetical protein
MGRKGDLLGGRVYVCGKISKNTAGSGNRMGWSDLAFGSRSASTESDHHSLLDRLHRRELHRDLDVARLECLNRGGEILPRKSIGEESRELTGKDERPALEEGCFCEISARRDYQQRKDQAGGDEPPGRGGT